MTYSLNAALGPTSESRKSVVDFRPRVFLGNVVNTLVSQDDS